LAAAELNLAWTNCRVSAAVLGIGPQIGFIIRNGIDLSEFEGLWGIRCAGPAVGLERLGDAGVLSKSAGIGKSSATNPHEDCEIAKSESDLLDNHARCGNWLFGSIGRTASRIELRFFS